MLRTKARFRLSVASTSFIQMACRPGSLTATSATLPPISGSAAIEPDQQPAALPQFLLAHDARPPGDVGDEVVVVVLGEDVLAQRQQLLDHGIALVGALDH